LDLMKLLLIVAALAGLSTLPCASADQLGCHVTVQATVELSGEELSLADLLAPGSCQTLSRAAARVHLGRTPLAGSVRVLPGNEVRDLLQKITSRGTALTVPAQSVPERIVVRRAGARASCADIGDQILPAPDSVPLRVTECGAEGRIAREAPLELTRRVWPALGSWEVSARCVHPSDCVPFLVRMRGSEGRPTGGHHPEQGAVAKTIPTKMITAETITARSASVAGGAPSSAPAMPVVRAGESVALVWDQDGIRLLVPVICLDRGKVGQTVQARLAHGQVVRAVVVSAGRLRAGS
jgi:hypothetical protein